MCNGKGSNKEDEDSSSSSSIKYLALKSVVAIATSLHDIIAEKEQMNYNPIDIEEKESENLTSLTLRTSSLSTSSNLITFPLPPSPSYNIANNNSNKIKTTLDSNGGVVSNIGNEDSTNKISIESFDMKRKYAEHLSNGFAKFAIRPKSGIEYFQLHGKKYVFLYISFNLISFSLSYNLLIKVS